MTAGRRGENGSATKSPPLEGVIFDLDGTVADTLPVAFASFRAAVSEFVGYDHSDDELRSYFGPSEEGIIRRIVPDDWERCLARYLAEYESRHAACTSPFPGMRDTLDLLRDRGISIGLVTGKVSPAVAITLRWLNLRDYFDVVEPGSPEGDVKAAALQRVVSKWGIDASQVAYVGDTPADMTAARGASVVGLGAAWSNGTEREALHAAGAEAVFDGVNELREWLDRRVT